MVSQPIGVRVAGRGGQGAMLAGFLLAQAGMNDGLQVVQTQSYGPEARLGATKTDVILSPHEIAYPEVIAPEIFVCLSYDAYVAYAHLVAPEAVSIIEERALTGAAAPDNAIVLPLIDTARESAAVIATNIVALGALVGVAGLVSERSMVEAIAARVAPEHLALNTQAFNAGLRLAVPYRERAGAVAT
jgi:2-oxoglutarate ferredoxin oxidoreductase subunit gamma